MCSVNRSASTPSSARAGPWPTSRISRWLMRTQVIRQMQAAGVADLRSIAIALSDRGIRTVRGGACTIARCAICWRAKSPSMVAGSRRCRANPELQWLRLGHEPAQGRNKRSPFRADISSANRSGADMAGGSGDQRRPVFRAVALPGDSVARIVKRYAPRRVGPYAAAYSGHRALSR
jgi:hypothetical protein